MPPVRTLPHVTKLDDAFGQFLVRIECGACGAVREVDPDSLARIAGPRTSFAQLTPRMRCSGCGAKQAQLLAIPVPRPRGVPRNPH